MIRVKICSYDDLPPEVQKTYLSNNGSGKESASYLLVYHNDKLVRMESSAMEPEDVSFWRDLAWVQNAIEQAYSMGEFDGTTRKGTKK